jgi:UDP-N-acetylmuramate dehydrogenase
MFTEGKLLKDYTTFGIGGPAKYFIEAQTIEQLQKVIAHCNEHQLKYFVLGKGSNTLFSDRGFDGVVILNKIHFCLQNGGEFSVGGGYSFSLLGTQTARKGYEGLEFASGIPGSVGGAIYMNAGANGQETFTHLKEVTFLDEKGELKIASKEQLKWGYRFSSFQGQKGAIAAAKFQLATSEEARSRQLNIIEYRKKSQPYTDLSAGCLFRNVEKKISAGALIESSGLKGFSMGGAEVSTLHANFIVNKNGATADDVLKLAAYVKEVVQEKTGYTLEMEIKVVPF